MAPPPVLTAAPRHVCRGGCSPGQALLLLMTLVPKPGRCSSSRSVCTATDLGKHTQEDFQSAVTMLSGCGTHIHAAHLSFSSTGWGLCRPLHNFWTPRSCTSLSERSRDLSVPEPITEARTSQHSWVRLQPHRLDTQRRRQDLLPTMGCGKGISVVDL